MQALKSQLQPHFLFNTLNSISALMLTDVAAAERMITLLGDLLPISLETASTQMTTLSQELEFLTCYIEIEKVRFEERLTVNFDVETETLEASIPHLLLQPLVDNAIKHGISRLVMGGEIRISARRDHDELHLEVSDNGPGLRSHRSSLPSGLDFESRANGWRRFTVMTRVLNYSVYPKAELRLGYHSFRAPLRR